jgi:hypothetical protein
VGEQAIILNTMATVRRSRENAALQQGWKNMFRLGGRIERGQRHSQPPNGESADLVVISNMPYTDALRA